MGDLLTPADVGLQAWRYEQMAPTSRPPDGYVIHTPGSSTQFTGAWEETCRGLQSWEEYHVEGKGWAGLAYDYWADLGGRKGAIRGEGRSAATSGDYDEDGIPNNAETDAILLILGNGQVPNRAMKQAVLELVDLLGPRRYVIGHREGKGTVTVCPGDKAMNLIVVPLREGRLLGHAPVRPDDGEGDDPPATAPKDWKESIVANMPTIKLTDPMTKGVDVRRVQGLLVAVEHDLSQEGGIDGWYGQGTEREVKAFQQARGLTADGVVGPKTWAKLLGV